MTPTIVLKDDKPFLIAGSPGGSTIITAVLQVIINVIDFGMDIQEAINAPRIHHQWFPDKINYENFGLPSDVKEALIEKGENIGEAVILGCVEGILIDNDNNIILGASDPRGNGDAEGY
jgi:gamma-glutamyltranspeptidase/glutathione hydrolase